MNRDGKISCSCKLDEEEDKIHIHTSIYWVQIYGKSMADFALNVQISGAPRRISAFP